VPELAAETPPQPMQVKASARAHTPARKLLAEIRISRLSAKSALLLGEMRSTDRKNQDMYFEVAAFHLTRD